jgi:hypothetical protein
LTAVYHPNREQESGIMELIDDHERGMETMGGYVTAEEVAEMLRLADAGESRRAISRLVYDGIDGGGPYQRVKGVLDALRGELVTA